jgi:hypothetical protein
MKMKTICTILLFTLLLSGAATPSFTEIPPSALLAESDLTALGTLKDLHVISRNGDSCLYGGTLQVEKILYGNADLNDGAVELRWNVVPGFSGSFNPADLGQGRGIWILTRFSGDGSGVFFTADHPSRFLPPERLAEVQSILRKPVYRISLSADEYVVGKPVVAAFTISAEADGVKADAYLQVVKGKLIFAGPVEIHVQNASGEVKRRGHLLSTAAAGPVTIRKGLPLSVDVDLSKSFYLISDGSYTLWWGSGSIVSPRYTFYLRKSSK